LKCKTYLLDIVLIGKHHGEAINTKTPPTLQKGEEEEEEEDLRRFGK